MIDECLDVLDTYKITKDDMKIIFVAEACLSG